MTRLNQQTRHRIAAIVQHDAEIQHQYKDSQGRMCVIGGLATAAHIPLPTGNKPDGGIPLNDATIRDVEIRSFAEAIAKAYGVDLDLLTELQNINDNHEDKTSRRRALIQFLDDATRGDV